MARVAVFGASGRTGRLVVRESLGRGHQVIAFVRDQSKLVLVDPQLRLVKGDATVATDVDAAVRSSEAVISSLGQSPGSPADVCSRGVANIISSMSKNGVKRLICQSSFGTDDTRSRGFYAKLLRTIMKSRMDDKEKMEREVRSSGLDWTVVRPTILTDGPKTGSYRTGSGIQVGLLPKISRADLAEFMVKQVTETAFVRSSPTITY